MCDGWWQKKLSKPSVLDKDTALVHEPPCVYQPIWTMMTMMLTMITITPTASVRPWGLPPNNEFLAKLCNMTAATMTGSSSPTCHRKQSLSFSDLTLVELENAVLMHSVSNCMCMVDNKPVVQIYVAAVLQQCKFAQDAALLCTAASPFGRV